MKYYFGFVSLAVVAALSLLSSGASAQDSYTLRIANFASANGGGGQAMERYAKELQDVSDGRLKVEVYHGSSMGPAPKHYDLVRSGVADMAFFSVGYTPGRFPKTDVFSLPNVLVKADTDAAATRLLMEVAADELFPEYEGVRVIWLAAVSQGSIYTSKAPIRTLEDIKGKRIRVSGGSTKEVLRAVGADPISVPAGEVAEGLQKNAFDGIHASDGTVWTMKLGELVKYQTPVLKVSAIAGFVINQRAYDNLPPDLQKAVDDLGGVERAVRFVKAYAEENPVVNDYIKGQSIALVAPDVSLVDAVAEASIAYNEAVLAAADAEHPEIRALYNRVRELDQAAN